MATEESLKLQGLWDHERDQPLMRRNMPEPEQPSSNPHAKWLRMAAEEIAKAGHNGWGNTCLQAADEIERLQQALAVAEGCMNLVKRAAAETPAQHYRCQNCGKPVLSGWLLCGDCTPAPADPTTERCCLCGGEWRAPNACMNAFHRWAGAEDDVRAPLPPEILAGALQDVVHTNEGPVRAGRAVKLPADVAACICKMVPARQAHPDCPIHGMSSDPRFGGLMGHTCAMPPGDFENCPACRASKSENAQ